MLFVEKFGGSSLAGVERVRCAARLIADTVRAGHSVAAVLSAQGKTTDALLSTAAHYSRSPSKRELDMLLATGEQASVALMAMTLEEMGLPAVSLTGWQAGVGTDETYGDAHVRRLSMERVRRELDEGKVVLIAGFQGVSPGNDITTLGRSRLARRHASAHVRLSPRTGGRGAAGGGALPGRRASHRRAPYRACSRSAEP